MEVKVQIAIVLIVAVLFGSFPLAAAAGEPVGESTGYFVVRMIDQSCGCPLDAGSVFFDGEFKGEISRGKLLVEVFNASTPYTSFRVEKDGFIPFTGSIDSVPLKNGTIELIAYMEPVEGPIPSLIEEDTGYYLVRCDVENASVFFDNDYKGRITEGKLLIEVVITQTPYSVFSVENEGYEKYQGVISPVPASGETLELVADMTPLPGKTQSPLSLYPVFLALVFAAVFWCIRRE
jgi:hypothetical protein